MSPIVPHFANECLEDLGQKVKLVGQKLMKNIL